MRIRGQRPTRKQKQLIESHRLNPDNWLVTKQPAGELHLQHKDSGKKRIISA